MHQTDFGLEQVEHGGPGSEFIDGVAAAVSEKEVDPVTLGVRTGWTKAALFPPSDDQGFSQGRLRRLLRRASVQKAPDRRDKRAVFSSPNVS